MTIDNLVDKKIRRNAKKQGHTCHKTGKKAFYRCATAGVRHLHVRSRL